MSKISFVLRPANKQGEHPVSVKHSHKGSPFTKSTGVSVVAKYFDLKTGTVSGKLPSAPEDNEKIRRVVSQMERAVRNLVGRGVDPTAETMSQAWSEIEVINARLIKNEAKTLRIIGDLHQQLKAELTDLLKQVEDKKEEILSYELRQGIHEGRLLSGYCTRYAKSIEETAAYNTTRLFEGLSKTVARFDSTWRIDEVNDETLGKFEKWLIAQGKRNLTITDTITKVKTVVYHYAKPLKLDIVDLRLHRSKVIKKRNPNVVYLSKSELQDLIDLPLNNEVERRVRDRFVLMSLIGVRYSDSSVKPENIFNGELMFSTEKTDTDITIPISNRVLEILTRYDNNIPAYPLQHFNKVIKKICSRVKSLDYQIQVKTYTGQKKPVKSAKKKYEAMSAHVARRTFINLALLKGIPAPTIAGIVGHEGTDLIMNIYGSKEAGKDKIASIMD